MSRAHDKSRLEWETSCTVFLRPASPFVQLLLRFRIAETVTVMHSSLATALSVDCTIWTVHASVSFDRSPPVVLQRCCKAATSGMRRHRHCNRTLYTSNSPYPNNVCSHRFPVTHAATTERRRCRAPKWKTRGNRRERPSKPNKPSRPLRAHGPARRRAPPCCSALCVGCAGVPRAPQNPNNCTASPLAGHSQLITSQ